MELYHYKAMDQKGHITRGRFDAVNSGDLELRLNRVGLDLITYKVIRAKGQIFTGSSVKRTDLITFCFHLEQLLNAGVPMLDGLGDLRDSVESRRLREVTSAMIESIGGGKNLSAAMADFPSVFTAVFVSLVRAGEESGQLPMVLRNISDNLKWQDEQAAHMKKLFMYPTFVAVLVTAVTFFLMAYLVPELVRFIQTMNQELPLHTKVLIWVSNLFANYWYILLLAPIIALAVLFSAVRTHPNARLLVDGWKLKMPVIGPIYKKLLLTRFSNYFAIMYASGINVLDCVKMSEAIVDNKVVEQAISDAGRNIAEGSAINTAFRNTHLFPPLVLRMLKIGETTGSLDNALQNVSYFYNRDVKESMERLQTIIEPTMTVILGLLLAWVMFSILGPIYDLITKINI